MSENNFHHYTFLFKRIAEGDEPSFRAVFEQLSPKVMAYSVSLTRSEYLAEEVVQEVFATIWKNRRQLAGIESVEAWVITIARNIGSNMLRRMAHERLIINELSKKEAVPDDLQRDLEWKKYHEQLYKVVSRLPPQQHKVWVMSRQLDMKQRVIAQELGISLYTVKEYLKKAEQFIKRNIYIFFIVIPSFFVLFCLLT